CRDDPQTSHRPRRSRAPPPLLVTVVVSLEATANALMEVLAARHPTSGSTRLTDQQAHGLDEGHDTPEATKVLTPPAARDQPDPPTPPTKQPEAARQGHGLDEELTSSGHGRYSPAGRPGPPIRARRRSPQRAAGAPTPRAALR